MIFDNSEFEIRMQEQDYLNSFMQQNDISAWEYKDGALVVGRLGYSMVTIPKCLSNHIKIRRIVSPAKNLTIYGNLKNVQYVYGSRVVALKGGRNVHYESLVFDARMVEIYPEWLTSFQACKFCCEAIVFVGSYSDFNSLSFKGCVMHCKSVSLILTGCYPEYSEFHQLEVNIENLINNIFKRHIDQGDGDVQINCSVMLENGKMKTLRYKGGYRGIQLIGE